MPPYALNKFEIQIFYLNELRFNDIYSRNNLPKIKNGTIVINLDYQRTNQQELIRQVYKINLNYATYIGTFEVENILKEIKKLIGKKNSATNVYQIEAFDS